MKKNKYKLLLLFIVLFLIPKIVFAETSEIEMPLSVAIFMEAFISIHMTLFVLSPLSNIFGGENPKKLLKILFVTRVVILLFANFFISPIVALFDFFALFIGGFIIVPICKIITGRSKMIKDVNNTSNKTITINKNKVQGIELKCNSCQAIVSVSDKFCLNCGAPLTGNNMKVLPSTNSSVVIPPKVAVTPAHFDSMYSLPEDKMVEEFLKRELVKAQVDQTIKLIPESALKRKKIFIIIFSILLFIYIGMIFFHFPLLTYVIGAIILFIFFKVSTSYNLIKYLSKEVKSRPNEKISNIVMNVKTSFVQDNTLKILCFGIIFALLINVILFMNPRILYESVDGGYAVRYYIFGITNFTTATIPETYNDADVISLRGNTFSNMPFLKEVSLPDTIIEIRGQAFKNDINLENIKLPKKLQYLGGRAFYNCTSLKNITLPNSLEELGGESFYGASSLEMVKLSDNLKEIRGNTFENCTSLTSITIPDSVTRIGGHAFYGNSSLSKVVISENSKLKEIGSSAFRRCGNLLKISIPSFTYVNERAFKESPTIITRYKGNDDYFNNNYYE